ncbi:uncharacterized protein LOC122924254 [Bufo gargarizans]|uniref:uncharacterized protein LOC122924254 n=1 Tax=Bufo gargarizans TaxID=30331 RepID=UPI001CF480A3|nr:uncharacterized protein LOC122924254 [Bufo gargarizans]
MSSLIKGIEQGGIAFPDIRRYNLACMARYICDWINGSGFYSALPLEKEFCAPWSLVALLHARLPAIPRWIKKSLLFKDTIAAWRILRKKYWLSYRISKHLPLWNNPEFIQGNKNQLFEEWRRKGIVTVKHLLHDTESRWLTCAELIAKFSLSPFQIIQWSQVREAVINQLGLVQKEIRRNILDRILDLGGGKVSISTIYADMRKEDGIGDRSIRFGKWAEQLEDEDMAQKMVKGWEVVRRHVVNESWRDTQFRLMYRAIYGFNIPPHPAKPDRITSCPKCGVSFTDLFHGIWTCPQSKRVWEEVGTLVKGIWGREFPLSPQLYLFHYEEGEAGQGGLPRLFHTICMMVKRSILQTWLQADAPGVQSIIEQLKKVFYLERLNSLAGKERQAKGLFQKWKPFIAHCMSDEEIRLIMSLFTLTKWYLVGQLKGTLGRLLLRSANPS